MSLNQPDLNAAFRRSLHDHWRAFLIEGIILVVLGAKNQIMAFAGGGSGERPFSLQLCSSATGRYPTRESRDGDQDGNRKD